MEPIPGGLSVIDAADGVVLVAGELDAATGARLIRRLSARPRVRVLDLSAVTFIDASGLRILLRATDGAARRRLDLRAPSPSVVRLCELTGLTTRVLGSPAPGS